MMAMASSNVTVRMPMIRMSLVSSTIRESLAWNIQKKLKLARIWQEYLIILKWCEESLIREVSLGAEIKESPGIELSIMV